MSENKPVTLAEVERWLVGIRPDPLGFNEEMVVDTEMAERLAESYRNLVAAAQGHVQECERTIPEGYECILRAALPEEPEEWAGE